MTAWTQPTARTPQQLTRVSSHTTAIVTTAEAPGTLAIQGAKALV